MDLAAGSGQFHAAKQNESWPVPATIAMSSATGNASRRNADVLPVRSIAG